MDSSPRGQQNAANMMPPPAPRPPKRGRETILEEDEWLSKMEGIIERDFFPELGKLQDKVAWLEAVRSGDPEKIRQAQLQIAQRASGNTPYITTTTTSSRETFPSTGNTLNDPNFHPLHSNNTNDVPLVPLDKFLATHNSEDNASFRDILDKTNKKRREKATAIYGEPRDANKQLLLLTQGANRDSSTDGYGTTGQATDRQIGWKYTPVNLLMYDGSTRNSLPLSRREKSRVVAGPPPAINHSATRLMTRNTTDYLGGNETPNTSGDTSILTSGSGGDVELNAALKNVNKELRGYDILATPSFDPDSVEASPFITWGEIEATPMRIEAEDLPPGTNLNIHSTRGPSFRMQETPKREVKAHELAAKAGASMRRRPGSSKSGSVGGMTPARAAAMAALGKTPKSIGNSTPLSHAALKLVGKIKKASGGGGGGGDAALRASYRGSGGTTPGRNASSGWESGAATPRTGGWTTPAKND